jgi:DNA-binding response OmpR family regulator
LQLKGKFEVVRCSDGDEGLIAFTKEAFDICILDVMMPKKDGFTLGKEIRKINPHIPLIFATAKTMIEDKTEAFTLGCDDYITKPFRIEELLLRINALLKRVPKHKNEENSVQQSSFQIGDFVFDVAAQQITYKENTQRLSTKEAELLKLLCQKQNQVLTREEALLAIWHDDNYFNGRSMDVFLSKLRKYLKADPKVEIMNIHGRGYKLFIH